MRRVLIVSAVRLTVLQTLGFLQIVLAEADGMRYN